MEKSRLILWLYVTFFSALGVVSAFRAELTVVDNFFAAAFCGFVLYLSRSHKISARTALFAGLIFMLHIIGNLALYSAAELNYHWDWFVHFSSALFSTVTVISFLIENGMCRGFHSAAAIGFFLTVSTGAFIEMGEYGGFILIGFGKGYLGFGEGDNSQNFGPWENSSLDTTFNFLGGAIGIMVAALLFRRELRGLKNQRKNSKKA